MLARRVDARVDQPGGAIHQAFERILPRRHLAELVLDGAEAGDRHAELLARAPRTSPLRRSPPGRRPSTCAELEAAEVEDVERDLVALADLAEHVLGRHLDVLEDHRRRRRAVQAHLVLLLAAAHAGPGALDDEGGEVLAVDLGEDDEEVGEAAVGDPHLLARQHEAAVGLPHRARLGAERVRPRPGLAQAVGADVLAGDQAGQVLLLLRFGAEHVDRQDGEVGLRAEGGAERRAARRSARRRPASRPCRDRRRRTLRARWCRAGRGSPHLATSSRLSAQSFCSSRSSAGSTSWSMNSAAVCAISRCSSLSCSVRDRSRAGSVSARSATQPPFATSSVDRGP